MGSTYEACCSQVHGAEAGSACHQKLFWWSGWTFCRQRKRRFVSFFLKKLFRVLFSTNAYLRGFPCILFFSISPGDLISPLCVCSTWHMFVYIRHIFGRVRTAVCSLGLNFFFPLLALPCLRFINMLYTHAHTLSSGSSLIWNHRNHR